MRKMLHFRSVILVLSLTALTLGSSMSTKGQTPPDPKKFAIKYKDKLTRDEVIVLLFCFWCKKSVFDFPPQIWPQTIELAEKIPFVQQSLHVLSRNPGPPYSFELVNRITGKTEQPEQWQVQIPTSGARPVNIDTGKSPGSKWKLFARQSYNQVGFPDMWTNGAESTSGPGAAAKPAILSYAYNQLKATDTWTAQGSLIAGIFLHGEPPPGEQNYLPYLSEVLLTPSVTFDKITGSGATQKPDSLVFRLGSLFEFPGLRLSDAADSGDPALVTQFVRLNFTHATDWEFRSQILGGELEWEPVPIGIEFLPLDRWLALRGPLLDQFEVLFRAYLHGEAGSILNPGQKKDLASIPGEYARAGFHVEASLKPIHFKRLTLSTSYEDFESMVASSPSEHMFITGAQWALDDKGTISLTVQYRNGRLPLTLDKVEDFTAGIGLKF
jgi:hypothetical protein